MTAIGTGPPDLPCLYAREAPERPAFYKSQALNDDLTRSEDIVAIGKFPATGGRWLTGWMIYADGGGAT